MDSNKITIEIQNPMNIMQPLPSITPKSQLAIDSSVPNKHHSDESGMLPAAKSKNKQKRRSASFSLFHSKVSESFNRIDAGAQQLVKFRVEPSKAPEPAKNHKRLYEVWPGNNQFFCHGRCITGPWSDLYYLILTWAILAGISVVYFALVVPYLTANLTTILPFFSGILLFLTVIFFLLTSYCDPGIIPRKEVFELFGNIPEQFTAKVLDKYIHTHVPISIEEKNNVIQSFKYCNTCRIFRPPRASHCAYCDNCIEVFDHHCPFLGNCVGKRNYRYFVLFLATLVIYGCTIIGGFVALGIASESENTFLNNKIVFYVIIGILGCGLSIILCLIISLLFYHIMLAFKGETTKENLTHSKSHAKVPRPKVNICFVDPSWVNYRAKVGENECRELIDKKPQVVSRSYSSSVPSSPMHRPETLRANPGFLELDNVRRYDRYDLSGAEPRLEKVAQH